MMEAKRLRVQFHDECPTIGSGWRLVEVKEGHKWVRLRCPATDARAKIHVSLWETISSNAVSVS